MIRAYKYAHIQPKMGTVHGYHKMALPIFIVVDGQVFGSINLCYFWGTVFNPFCYEKKKIAVIANCFNQPTVYGINAKIVRGLTFQP